MEAPHSLWARPRRCRKRGPCGEVSNSRHTVEKRWKPAMRCRCSGPSERLRDARLVRWRWRKRRAVARRASRQSTYRKPMQVALAAWLRLGEESDNVGATWRRSRQTHADNHSYQAAAALLASAWDVGYATTVGPKINVTLLPRTKEVLLRSTPLVDHGG